MLQRWFAWDLAGVLPVYRYFAPQPGRFDYHLLVRHEEARGRFTPWSEVDPDTPRRATDPLFNPARRIRKARFDLLYELSRTLQAAGGDLSKVQLSYPYLALLLRAERALKDCAVPPGTRFQFLLLARSAYADIEPRILALSPVHRLD
ncbi:hypothetical protein [Thermaurantiacus sp.]